MPAPRDASALHATTPPVPLDPLLMVHPRLVSPGHNRMHIDDCSLDANIRAVLTRLLLAGSSTSDAAQAAFGHGVAIMARPTGRRSQSSHDSYRAFVTTRSGLDTMPTSGQDDDIAEAGTDSRAPDAAHGAARRSGTVPSAATLTPPAAPADLLAALAKTPYEWGRHMFETTALDARMAACKLTMKDPADLLILRQTLFEELGPPFIWIFYTSVLE
jgi:hypothetical protein